MPWGWSTPNTGFSLMQKRISQSLIKGHYCYKRSLVARGPISPPILSLGAFELQASVFKCTMKANLAATMEPPFLVNPFTKLWCSLSMSHILKHSFPEYFKLAKIATMQVLGSVEDERTFSTLSFNFVFHEIKVEE